jgi:hypothetical protein
MRPLLNCCLELPLRGHEEIYQPIDVDPSLTYILFELIAGIHADKLLNRPSRSCASFRGICCKLPSEN